MTLPRIVQAVNARVSLAGDESISDVKTYTDSPVVPDVVETDFSQKTANTKFVKTAVRHAVDELQKQINALEGVVLTATDNTAVAYSKAIPTSANLFKYAAIRSFGGRSIVWNQLGKTINDSNYSTFNGSVTFQDGVATFTASAQWGSLNEILGNIKINVGHKYFITGEFSFATLPTSRVRFDFGSRSYTSSLSVDVNDSIVSTDTWTRVSSIGTYTTSAPENQLSNGLYVMDYATSDWKPIRTRNFMWCDLTSMFGAGNEPSTVDEFRAIFPNDIPAFNAGEIKSAGVNKIVSADSNSVEIDAKNIPQAILDLPGYGWSAGTAKNWVDWENKVYHQEVAQVDLGNLTWGKNTYRFYAPLPSDAKIVQAWNGLGLLIGKNYQISPTSDTEQTTGCLGTYSNNVYISDPDHYSDDATAFKTAMTGVKLNYELGTSVETDISALIDDNVIEVESGGTITFENSNGDSYRIPVPSSLVTMEKP
jgi:hypothetical protein